MPSKIADTTPPVPRVPSAFSLRVWGFIHAMLARVSEHYCSWFVIYDDPCVYQLPFGLIMKWNDRISLEEAMAMQMARAAGMPVPKLLSIGKHPGFRQFSLLMTRLPGYELINSADPFDLKEEGPWVQELQMCIRAMRLWKPTFGPSRICSVLGTSIRSIRVPHRIMGPFENQKELHEYLLSTASRHGFESKAQYQETLLRAKKIQERPHRIVFTHGDFKAHNILIGEDGHLTGFLDWESAGWCPEYWDFTTAIRYGRDSWWYQVVSWLGGDEYMQELDADIALNKLTVDSYVGM